MLSISNLGLLSLSSLGLVLALAACGSDKNSGTPGGAAGTPGSNPGTGGSPSSSNAGSPGIPGAGAPSSGAGTTGLAGAGNTAGAPSGSAGTTGAGGAATGASGSGGGTSVAGGPAVAEPELVTSGKGDYWKVGTLTKGGTTATITVTSTGTAQAWDGFGGTFNEKGAQMLNGLDATKQAEIMKKLFDVTDGIGLTWGRIPIGPSDYAIAPYSFQDSATATFSIDHDKTKSASSPAPLMPFIKAAIAVKSDIKFWGSAWTPPPWMKDNNAYNKGSMTNTKANLDAYATYLVNWIKAYEAEGIKINFIVPQNEPGWSQNYPTCAWGSYTDSQSNMDHFGTAYLGDFVKNNLSPAMMAANLTTNIWYGTFSNNNAYPDYWRNVPASNLLKGVALQWATSARVADVIAAGFKVMQSEHQCGNYPWKGKSDGKGGYTSSDGTTADNADANSFFLDYAPNNHNYAIESWGLIKSWIDLGVNSYSAWNMVLDKKGANLDTVRVWPQNALIVVDGTTVTYTPAYYVFRHVAEFVEPGGTVLKVSGSGAANALAFKNPDGTVIVIAYNSGTAAAMTTLSIDGTMYQVNVPAQGWATVNKKGA
jgi:glucosylceramidase